MSKFTKILESNDPQMQDNDDMRLLSSLHKVCEGLGYNCNFEGSTLTVSLPEEEAESALGAIISLDDKNLKTQRTPESVKLLNMKRKVVGDLERVANNFSRSASTY